MADITTLQQSLINARKVMTKVDGGDFTKTGLSLPESTSTPNVNMNSVQQHMPQQPNINESIAPRQANLTPKAHMNEQKIKSSNLPDAIKEAMINTPIPDVPFNGGGAGLSEEFLKGVKTEMGKQGMQTSTPILEQPQNTLNTSPPPIQIPTTNTKKITSKNLKSIIKESVKELIDETIGLKTDNEENFQFRVGNKIFYGKITSSKSIK